MLIKPAESWIRYYQILDGLPILYRDKRRQFELNVARSLLMTIKKHLEYQDLGWQPLSPEYREWKEKNGLDTRIWMARRELVSKIKIIITPEGRYLVGIDPYEPHYSGLSAYHLAMVHEYGVPDLGIPARPLFRPSYWEVSRKYHIKAMTASEDLYRKYFRRGVWISQKI